MKKGWTYKKLGEVCDIVGGGTPNTKIKEYWKGTIPWATVSDMNCDEIKSTGYSITDRGLKESSSRIIKSGEIIIATRVGLGKVCKLAVDTAINQDLKGIIPKDNSILRAFIYYYFKQKAKYIVDNGVGATVKGVKIKFIEGLSFGFPSLSEQQSIVEYLDSSFAKIDTLKANAAKNLDEAKALFQSALKEALEPKEGWEYKTFRDISHSISDGDWIEKKDQSYSGIRLIQTGNIGVGKFIPKDDSRKFITEDTFKRLRCSEIFEGDVLISRLPNPLGRSCILPKLDTRCITAVDCSIVRIKKEVILSEYFIYYTQSQSYFAKIDSESSGTTRARITRKKLEQTEIPVPPLTEQQEIVSRLDSLNEKVNTLQQNYSRICSECDALKQAILRQVFE